MNPAAAAALPARELDVARWFNRGAAPRTLLAET